LDDPEQLLKVNPFLREWIVECKGCHARGLRTDRPAPDPVLVAKLDAKLQGLFQPLSLTPDGYCSQCHDPSEFQAIGSFAPSDADRLLKAFVEAEIPFEIEPSDSQIKQLDGHAAAFGGTFGTGALINVYVDPSHRVRATEITRAMFG
jgi:hypothetical protein